MIKINNRNTRTRCEICLKLSLKTQDANGAVNFEHAIDGWEGLCEKWRNFGRVENNVPHLNFQTPWTH